jgi:chemosensory pili system protein ChpE
VDSRRTIPLAWTFAERDAMLAGGSLHVVALWLMIAYCAAPGAVNAETVRRGLRGGFASALLVQLGAIVGRVLWAGLALAGAGVLAGPGSLHLGLTTLGALVLLHASWRALVASSTVAPDSPRRCAARHDDFTAGLLLSLTNPLALVFWSGFGSMLGLDGGGIWDARTAPAVLATLAVGALAWSIGVAAAISWGRHAVGRGSLRLAEVLAGVVLGFFGLQMLWETTGVLVSLAGL